MKQFYFTISLAVLCVTVFAQQDTITNAGFERWTAASSYEDPDGWTTLNPAGVILGAEMAFKATDSGEFNSGLASVKLVTANVQFFGMTPSVLTTGEVNTATQEIEGGWPINSRPTAFGGWFRYDANGVDTAFVSITLSRWDANSGVREIVGFAEADVFDTDSLFENVEMNIDYSSSEVPDTVLILISSGGFSAQENSALFVDDLYYNYSTDIKTPESVSLSLYPNPTTDFLTVKVESKIQLQQATLFAIDGKRILQQSVNGSNPTMDVREIPKGTYVIELGAVDGTVVRQRFIKN